MTEKKKEHRSAMLLRWIAAGYEIQCSRSSGIWMIVGNESLLRAISQGSEYTDDCYRIKPKTIRIGKYDVAEPMKESPATGTEYFWLDPRRDPGVDNYSWADGEMDKEMLARGVIWLNKEDAELAAKAIKELLTGQ